MRELTSWLERREATYLGRLRALVDCNSGLDNPAGRLQVLERVEAVYLSLGFSCERVARPGEMVHLVARRPAARPGAPKVLLLGHLDTVYDSTSPFQSFTEQGPWLAGPGVGDMKGGLVVAQAALDALAHLGRLGDIDWVCCHNADEEVTSPTSRDLVESCAADRDVCLDFEIGRRSGALVCARAGVGKYAITVHGKAAHAGMDHAGGVNAVVALAQLVVAIAALGDPEAGTTVNVGVFRGGTKRNVVPDEAKAEIDVRVHTAAEGDRVDRAVRALCAVPPLQGARIDVVGGIGRPPWPRGAANDAVVAHFVRAAADLGQTLAAEATGGGSDANFTAALGVPTVDGLGPVGEHPHTFDERIVKSSVVERAALVAHALLNWPAGGLGAG